MISVLIFLPKSILVESNDLSATPAFPFRTLSLHTYGLVTPRCKMGMIQSAYTPYLANTFGSVPIASLIRIGVCGLCFFITGYDFWRKVLRGT